MKKIFIFLYLFMPILIFFAFANESFGSGNLSLNMLIKKSLENPYLTAKALKTESSKENAALAKALPEPVIDFGFTNANGFNNPDIGTDSMSNIGFGISQKIPFPSKLKTKSLINEYAYESSEEKTRALKVNAVYLVKSEYYNLALIEKQISAIKYNRMLLKMVINYIARKYGNGESSAPSYIRTMMEDASLKAALFSLNKSKFKLVYLLSEITGLKESFIVSEHAILPDARKVNPSRLKYKIILKEAFLYNPDLKSLKYLNRKSNQELHFAKESYLPDFYLKAGYGNRYSMPPVLSASVGLSIPLYFNGYQEPLIDKAEKNKLASAYNIRWERLKIMKNIRTYLKNIKEDYNNYKLYKNLYVPETKLLFESELSSFKVQKATGFSLLDSFVKLADSEFKKNIYESKFFTDKANLESIEGKTR